MSRTGRVGLAGAVAILGAIAFVRAVEAAAPRPEEAYNYYRDATSKIPVFFQARGQLKLVIIGDSRGGAGVDPREFYREEKRDYPQALNLAVDAIGFDVEQILLDEYVSHAPKLQWVVFQISPRLFNIYYQDIGSDEFRDSPGYKYDQENKDTLWADLPSRIFRPKDLLPESWRIQQSTIGDWPGFCRKLEANRRQPGVERRIWGLMPARLRSEIRAFNAGQPLYDGERAAIARSQTRMLAMRHFCGTDEFRAIHLPAAAWRLCARGLAGLTDADMRMFNRLLLSAAFSRELDDAQRACRAWGWHADETRRQDMAKQARFLAATMKGRFEFADRRWAEFERILDDLAKRRVKVLGFVAPMHHCLSRSPCADDDGTLDAAYAAEMKSLKDLEDNHPNFFFCDLHRAGQNDFIDSDYLNWDHLNAQGAAKLTARLVTIQKAIDAQPKWDITPPEVESVTAFADPARVRVVFNESMNELSAEQAMNYAVSNGVTVVKAKLSEDRRTVTLKTSRLTEATDYTLTISNVTDKMDNAIAPVRIPFRFAKALDIRNTIPAAYVWDTLDPGKVAYCDKRWPWTAFPEKYRGMRTLRTAVQDKAGTGDSAVSFSVNYPVRVYVAHDENIAAKPLWMKSFTCTWDLVQIDGSYLRIAWKDFPAGKITLGGNQGPNANMYAVFVEPMGSVKASPK